jgi:hypothetical protein
MAIGGRLINPNLRPPWRALLVVLMPHLFLVPNCPPPCREVETGFSRGGEKAYSRQPGSLVRLELSTATAYLPCIDNPENHSEVPTGWLETLAKSEAELAAGQTVPGEVVRQRLLNNIARIETKQAAARLRGTASRR